MLGTPVALALALGAAGVVPGVAPAFEAAADEVLWVAVMLAASPGVVEADGVVLALGVALGALAV